MNIQYIIIFLIYLINYSYSSCTYTNSLNGQVYDLTLLAKSNGLYYEAPFVQKRWPNSTKDLGSYKAFFNFCELEVSACDASTSSQTLTACQQFDDFSNCLQLANVGDTEKIDTTNGMTLLHKSSYGTCDTPNNQREFYQYLNCNPNVVFNVTKSEELLRCKYEVYIDTKYVCRTCPTCSTIHGTCNALNGVCGCDSQTSGVDCKTSKLSITSVVPSTVNGGTVKINGFFGTTTSSLSIMIGTNQCKSIVSTSSLITCSIAAGTGIKDLILTDRDLNVTKTGFYEYQLLTCPLNCSAPHGTCDPYTGLCLCDTQTTGNGCQTSRLRIDKVDSTTVNGGNLTIYGYFGTTTSALKVWIGIEECLNVIPSNETLKCDIGPGIGYRNVTIIDRDLILSKVNLFKYNEKICPLNCSAPHGKCNIYTGLCMCDTQTQGDGCELSRLKVDKVDSTTINGGNLTIYGYFGTTAAALKVWIGSEECLNVISTNDTIKCDIGPGIGYKDIAITDGDISLPFGKQLYHYNLICPLNCSAPHGTCDPYTGLCSCDTQTESDDCSVTSIFISSCTSISSEGGPIDVNGYFGITTAALKIWIGDKPCVNVLQIDNDKTKISCDAPAGTGIQNIYIQDRDLSYSAANIFNYITISKPLICPNNCTDLSHGKCDIKSGICICQNEYYGADCASNSIDIISDSNPISFSQVNTLTSVALIGNVLTTYSIGLHSLVEISIDGKIIEEHPLDNISWDVESNNFEDSTISTFRFNLVKGVNINCTIIYTVIQMLKRKEFSFAGINFSKDPNSIKTTISISNYKYKSPLNIIQLRIKSGINSGNDQNQHGQDCNSKEISINTNNIINEQSLNYIIMSKDSKIFYSKIINQHISDNIPTYMPTSVISNNGSTLIVGLNLAHCVVNCLVDPDYSVLVGVANKSNCSENEKKWIVILSIVLPVAVVGVAAVVSVSILLKKYSVAIKIKIHSLKSKTFC